MNIDEKIIDKIANLSRLEFEAESKKEIMGDMDRILGFINKLNELDTKNVEPLIFISEEINVLREDNVEVTITQKDALKNAPVHDSDYFKVPKVLSK